jgi:hypothetical protein
MISSLVVCPCRIQVVRGTFHVHVFQFIPHPQIDCRRFRDLVVYGKVCPTGMPSVTYSCYVFASFPRICAAETNFTSIVLEIKRSMYVSRNSKTPLHGT